MTIRRGERLEQHLRDLVAICEMDDTFNDPGNSDAYSTLYLAKVALDPHLYINDHPVVDEACKQMMEEDRVEVCGS